MSLLDRITAAFRKPAGKPGRRALYPAGAEYLAAHTGVPSIAPPVSSMLRPSAIDDRDGTTDRNGTPIGEHNRALRARRWRGYAGRPGVIDQIRREDPEVQRIALLWEGPALQERDWTVETEHEGERAEAIRASVDATLRSVRSRTGVGIVRGLLAHLISTPWRGFGLVGWSFELTDERLPSGALAATLAVGRPIMPWAVERWDPGTAGDQEWNVWFDVGTTTIICEHATDAVGGGTQVATGTILVNTWYFVRIEHDPAGDLIKIATDGNAFTTAATGSGGNTGSAPFTIGRSGDGAGSAVYMEGRLDEAFLTKQAFTQAQWEYIWNSTSGRSWPLGRAS